MICSKCKELGIKSQVYDRGSSVTLMGYQSYYDEEGIFHNHNPNIRATVYTCSNKHKFILKDKVHCPTCEYGSDSESVEFFE